ncbi:MAG TPA: SDR family oxidoreductase [Nocardioides sp.]|uniref:SDR family NAD(P)-dependent oxidoreductase n=1 Tax=Nocardioides sp. TaxID=35761 RepID=UPI002B5215A2|nr:SDR family oxidoreductase [Nocardioides sp.]HTW18407.1 SDR family oxidoreductase [Nocardioides sp.]
MTGRLAGRVAVVTGAGDGIGAAVARAYAAEGARVVVAELSEESGRAVAAEVDGHFVRTDVSDKAQVHAMVDAAVSTYGSIDVLVNNAWGAGSICRVEDKTDAMIDGALSVGFRGPLWAMQAVFGHMKERGWGRVVNMCSLNGVNAHVGSLEYNATKEALRTLTRTAAREWAPTGVVVNALCPGAKSAAFRRVMGEHPELEAAADRGNPMGRIGDPLEDIAPVAVFLASEDCRYLTGNTLFVDGGAHINGVAWQPELP